MTSLSQKSPSAEVRTSATGIAIIWSMTSVRSSTARTFRRVGMRISNPNGSVRGHDVIECQKRTFAPSVNAVDQGASRAIERRPPNRRVARA